MHGFVTWRNAARNKISIDLLEVESLATILRSVNKFSFV